MLDTDVFSCLWLKPRDTRAKLYAPHVKGKTPAISFVTLGELRFWSCKNKWGKPRIDDLEDRLRSVIIVPYDDAICDMYAQLKAEMWANGKTISDNDLWIAACAVRHSITLITHNRKHFVNVPRLILISECAIAEVIESQPTLDLKPSTTSNEP
jgi:predicted nucleic acid-binding protein